MKLAIVCQSLLLENALKLFLKPYIVPFKQSDFIVCDYKIESDKPQFRVKSPESNIAFPFSKSALLLSLEKFSKAIEVSAKNDELAKPLQNSPDFSTLEEKLNQICNQFNQQIIQTIKEHYER